MPSAAGLPGSQPLLQRNRTLAGPFALKQTGDRQVLVKVRPMNVRTVTEDLEIVSFVFRTMPKPRIPNQRDNDGSTVDEIDAQGFIANT